MTERPDILTPLSAPELYDPLSDVTRAERKFLLLTSLISLALTSADLIPTQIDFLGLSISSANQDAILALLGMTLIYFLAAFLVYGNADYARWRVAHVIARRQSTSTLMPVLPTLKNIDPADNRLQSVLSEVIADVELRDIARRRSMGRMFFEFSVPLCSAVVAAMSIVAKLIGLPDPIHFLLLTSPLRAVMTIIGTMLGLVLLYNRYRKANDRSSVFSALFYRLMLTKLSLRLWRLVGSKPPLLKLWRLWRFRKLSRQIRELRRTDG